MLLVTVQNYIPVKGLHDAGVKVTLSSDWDVSQPNPFLGGASLDKTHTVSLSGASCDLLVIYSPCECVTMSAVCFVKLTGMIREGGIDGGNVCKVLKVDWTFGVVLVPYPPNLI